MNQCSVDICESPVKARGLCDAHYYRKHVSGRLRPDEPVRKHGLSAVERFVRTVKPGARDECWNWPGACLPYGKVTDTDGRQRPAHRVSLEIHLGHTIPAELEVLHSCDNPACVNPNHLSVGTHAQNMAEMSARRRAAVGERSARFKLTTADVVEIHRLSRGGATNDQIAARFGVVQSTVSRIISGKRRPDVPVTNPVDRRRRVQPSQENP